MAILCVIKHYCHITILFTSQEMIPRYLIVCCVTYVCTQLQPRPCTVATWPRRWCQWSAASASGPSGPQGLARLWILLKCPHSWWLHRLGSSSTHKGSASSVWDLNFSFLPSLSQNTYTFHYPLYETSYVGTSRPNHMHLGLDGSKYVQSSMVGLQCNFVLVHMVWACETKYKLNRYLS